MEYSGYAAKNSNEFWIDPFDYKDILDSAALSLHRRGMMTSIYNIPFWYYSSHVSLFMKVL